MSYNVEVEEFRDREYPYLIGKTYLDHGGTTLYAKSLIDDFSHDLLNNLYGNPHSASTPSAIAGHRVDIIREKTLRFFGADPEHYDLIFVSNATAAMKLVMECMSDFAQSDAKKLGFWYGYHKDAHNSLVGIRELSKGHKCFESDKQVESWISKGTEWSVSAKLGLFAYPGQSNMTGRRLPLSWCAKIRKSNMCRGPSHSTYTLLDAAALATSAPLDLSDPAIAPDFTCLSFYKIFGFPDVGGLIVRKQSAHVLRKRRYFGGGTVDFVTTIGSSLHHKRDSSLHDQLEDGTLPFHNIFALGTAIDVHSKLFKSMKSISEHTAYLAQQMYTTLSSLTWPNGQPVLQVYNEMDGTAVYGDATLQGATIAFNVFDSNKKLIPSSQIERLADLDNIYVRSGTLCNPGGIASYLKYSPTQLKVLYALGHRCSNPLPFYNDKPIGVVRVSLGAMSTIGDIENLLKFFNERLLADEAILKSEAFLSTLRSADSARIISTTTEDDAPPQLHIKKLAVVSIASVDDNKVKRHKYWFKRSVRGMQGLV